MAASYEYREISDAADAIRAFIILNENKLPAHLHERLTKLTKTGESPVELVTVFVKAVYANRGKTGITNVAKKIAAGAADLIDVKGFHERLDDRAGRMATVLMRDGGVAPAEGKEWPDEIEDPEIDVKFLPEAEIAALEIPAGPPPAEPVSNPEIPPPASEELIDAGNAS